MTDLIQTETATTTTDKRVAFLTAPEGVERVELTEPWSAVTDAGPPRSCSVPRTARCRPSTTSTRPSTQTVDRLVKEARWTTTTPWCCPAASPTRTRCAWTRTRCTSSATFVASGKPVAAICHAGWTARRGRRGARTGRVTSWPSLQTDLRNAGATWVDKEVVTDGNLITSRNPGDIPAFNNAVLEALAHGAAGTQ